MLVPIVYSQVLVYFAVAKQGDAPLDGKTDLNPEGLTAAWGVHAESFAKRLHQHGLSCGTPDRQTFTQAMLEKLIWIRLAAATRCSSGWLLCARKLSGC